MAEVQQALRKFSGAKSRTYLSAVVDKSDQQSVASVGTFVTGDGGVTDRTEALSVKSTHRHIVDILHSLKAENGDTEQKLQSNTDEVCL